MAGSTTFTVHTGRLLWVVFLSCLIIEVALVYLDLTINWWRWYDSDAIRRLFNITREDGLASWFQVSQTLVVALTAWLLVVVMFHQPVTAVRRGGWIIVALFFSYMCIDDGAAVHERLGTALRSEVVSAFPSYAWQFLLLPFFGIMGAFTLYFLWREMPRRIDRLKVAAAIGCFVVAVALDFVEGLDDGYRGLAAAAGWDRDAIRHFSKSLEEFIEMVGVSIFLVTFIGHVAAVAPRMDIRFIDERASKVDPRP